MDELENKIVIEKLCKVIEKTELGSYKKGIAHYKNLSNTLNKRSIEDIMGEEDDF